MSGDDDDDDDVVVGELRASGRATTSLVCSSVDSQVQYDTVRDESLG